MIYRRRSRWSAACQTDGGVDQGDAQHEPLLLCRSRGSGVFSMGVFLQSA
jgi:hypothetical protein